MSDIHTFHTTCPMDCPDTCALEVRVNGGMVESIQGGGDHPTTAGFICTKVAQFSRRLYHQERLLHPMKRRGVKGEGDFVRISWEEAIREITDRFQAIIDKWGGEAILPYRYGGSNGFLTDGFIDELYFARLGASRLATTLCAAPTSEVARAVYGRMPTVAFEDFPEAKLILIWGANPRASNIHLMPFLKRAKRKGTFVAVVDPVRNLSSDLVDLHLPVYPGSDLPVALSMIGRWTEQGVLARDFLEEHAEGWETLLERAEAWPVERAAKEARVDADDIRRLADAYAEAAPALVRCGWGVERNRNGGQAVAAILAMPALLGKFGVRGGGYALSNSGAGRVDETKLWETSARQTRIVNMTQLAAVLTRSSTPPVKGLFVYNCNPAITVPDQNNVLEGLKRDDLFTVVFDQMLTDTARFADVVLPATTFLEHYDIRRAYGSYVVGGIRPVVEPRGEARPNYEVFASLGRAMGFGDEAFSWNPQTALGKLIDAIELYGARADPETLRAGKIQRYDFSGPTPIQFGTVFPETVDGKVHLTPDVLGSAPYRYLPLESKTLPLAFLSPASTKSINSTLGEWSFRELELTIHPEDASNRRITDGDRIRAFNSLGEVFCRARVSDRVSPGVVLMPKGAWRKVSANGQTATALCPADVQEVGGGACYNDARVEVEGAG